MGSSGGEDMQLSSGWRIWGARWWLAEGAVPHLHTGNREEQLGSKTDHTIWGSSVGK